MKNNNLRTIVFALFSGLVFFGSFYFLLSQFFAGNLELKQNFSVGSLTIQYYGLILAIAATAGYFLAQHRRKTFALTVAQADKIILVLVLSGFVGARLYHVFSEFSFYTANPLQIFSIWNGGLSIYGAMIGGVIGIILYLKFWREQNSSVTVWSLLDWLVPSLALGQVIGRFGNFVNYEIYGTPTTLPWKMFVPEQFRRVPFEFQSFFHPLFLYESAASVVILVLLLKLKVKSGTLFLTWLLMYNVVRFFLEQIRVGSVMYAGIRVNAIVSLALSILAIVIYFKYVKPSSQNN